jgi:hypothetical protein
MSKRDKRTPWTGRRVQLVSASVAGILTVALIDAAVAQQAEVAPVWWSLSSFSRRSLNASHSSALLA